MPAALCGGQLDPDQPHAPARRPIGGDVGLDPAGGPLDLRQRPAQQLGHLGQLGGQRHAVLGRGEQGGEPLALAARLAGHIG
jgi:hypothetical protein